jgi:hypothetical protein
MSVPKFVFSRFGRGAALITAAAMTLAAIEPSVAMAGTATSRPRGLSVSHGVSGNTDISAARRWHRGGGAAAMAAFAGIAGTIGAIAAAQERRDLYYDYDGGPAYYGGGPVYYGGGPVYYGGGPRYYGSPGYGYYGRGYGGYGVYDPLGYGYNDRGGH